MKKLIGVGAACALVVGVCLVFVKTAQVGTSVDTKPAAHTQDASRAASAAAEAASSSQPLSSSRVAVAAKSSFDWEVRGLWSMSGAQLRQVFQRGVASAALEDKYLAYLAYDLCYSTYRTLQYPEIPGVTGDVVRHMNDGRRTLRTLCAPFLSIPLEQLTRDGDALHAAIAAPASPFSLSLPEHADDAARERFRQTLRAQFEAYGPAALQWNAANLAEWLLQKDLPPGQSHGSGHTPESRRVETAVHVAMCYVGFDCSKTSGGLLVLCTQSAVCGSDLRDALLGQLEGPVEREQTDKLARLIGRALASGQYSLLSL